MSSSFVAGQRLTAALMPFQRLWSVSSTTASASFTSITALLTSPSVTYTAGSAYLLQYVMLPRATVANTTFSFEIRDTNTAGTQRMGTRAFATAATATNYDYNGLWTVANTTASDIVGRTLAFCGTASSSGTINAGSSLPFWFACYYLGLSADYPEAVSL